MFVNRAAEQMPPIYLMSVAFCLFFACSDLNCAENEIPNGRRCYPIAADQDSNGDAAAATRSERDSSAADANASGGANNDASVAEEGDAATFRDAGEQRSVEADASTVAAPCAPATPPTEICNGRDDNCDGEKDEGSVCDVPKVVQTVIGGLSTCALFSSGKVRCWGLGSPMPKVVDGIDDAIAIAAGPNHTCVLRADKTVSCWGAGEDGKLGTGGVTSTDLPLPVIGLSDVVQIAAGDRHTCARLSNGTVRCWGSNEQSQLGRPATEAGSPAPVEVVGVSNAVEIAASSGRTCARLGGNILCWGRWKGVAQMGSVSNAVSIALGGINACAVRTTGSVFCWDDDGAHADPGGKELIDAVEVAVGDRHMCVRHALGDVSCWGDNFMGQLGDDRAVLPNKRAAGKVPGLIGVAKLSAGAQNTCALSSASKVSCWGANGSGQTGATPTEFQGTPFEVLGL